MQQEVLDKLNSLKVNQVAAKKLRELLAEKEDESLPNQAVLLLMQEALERGVQPQGMNRLALERHLAQLEQNKNQGKVLMQVLGVEEGQKLADVQREVASELDELEPRLAALYLMYLLVDALNPAQDTISQHPPEARG